MEVNDQMSVTAARACPRCGYAASRANNFCTRCGQALSVGPRPVGDAARVTPVAHVAPSESADTAEAPVSIRTVRRAMLPAPAVEMAHVEVAAPEVAASEVAASEVAAPEVAAAGLTAVVSDPTAPTAEAPAQASAGIVGGLQDGPAPGPSQGISGWEVADSAASGIGRLFWGTVSLAVKIYGIVAIVLGIMALIAAPGKGEAWLVALLLIGYGTYLLMGGRWVIW